MKMRKGNKRHGHFLHSGSFATTAFLLVFLRKANAPKLVRGIYVRFRGTYGVRTPSACSRLDEREAEIDYFGDSSDMY